MRVAAIKDGKICVSEVADLNLGDFGEGAIVKTLGCGLCGSDIVKFREKLVQDGTVLGHEIVAQVVKINCDCGFSKGDMIVSSHHIPCFECAYCKSENYSMCAHFKETNIRPGGFSEYIFLSAEHLKNVAYKIPENLSEQEASFYEPLGCCVRAVKRANLIPSSKVLVIGLGSIGLLMGQAIKAFGHEVYGCDIISERVELARNLGIKAFDSSKIMDEIFAGSENLGADAIFMTAGADVTIDLALKTVRSGGKIMVFASTPKNFGYANNEIYYRELTVMGSYSPAPVDLLDSLELLSSGKVVVKGLSTEYNLDEIEKSFHDTIENKILKAYVKIGEAVSL